MSPSRTTTNSESRFLSSTDRPTNQDKEGHEPHIQANQSVDLNVDVGLLGFAACRENCLICFSQGSQVRQTSKLIANKTERDKKKLKRIWLITSGAPLLSLLVTKDMHTHARTHTHAHTHRHTHTLRVSQQWMNRWILGVLALEWNMPHTHTHTHTHKHTHTHTQDVVASDFFYSRLYKNWAFAEPRL